MKPGNGNPKPSELAQPRGTARIAHAEFEEACEANISGSLWDETFSLLYQEPITLAVAEMRYIANLLRAADGVQPGVVRPWIDDEPTTD